MDRRVTGILIRTTAAALDNELNAVLPAPTETPVLRGATLGNLRRLQTVIADWIAIAEGKRPAGIHHHTKPTPPAQRTPAPAPTAEIHK